MKLNITNVPDMVRKFGRPSIGVSDDQYSFSHDRSMFKEPLYYYKNNDQLAIGRIEIVLHRKINEAQQIVMAINYYSMLSKLLKTDYTDVFVDEIPEIVGREFKRLFVV